MIAGPSVPGVGGRLLGVILAGGESRRLGEPKALARLGGRPLWMWAADALAGLDCPVGVVANDETVAASIPLPVRPDVRQGRGPLAGIETGLRWAQEEGRAGIFILACDLPGVSAGLVTAIAERWPGRGMALCEAPGPWGVEPLCGVYGVDLAADVARLLDGDRGAPGDLLAVGPVRRVTGDELPPGLLPSAFHSVNRPEDLAAFRHRMGEG